MKHHYITILVALIFGYLGGYFHHLNNSNINVDKKNNETIHEQNFIQNPFQTPVNNDTLKLQVEQIQLTAQALQKRVNELERNQNTSLAETTKPDTKQNKKTTHFQPNKDNLMTAGITADLADDMLRRISEQDFKRLELQNLIQRSKSKQRREYSTQLRELNKNKISLRSELGDETYDLYLYASGQNNRVQVTSVMASSPAETAGFQTDDIILYYDNHPILNWTDLRTATMQGEIGGYTSIEILRDGSQMSLMVPRGTLGVQLDAIQIKP